MSKRQKKKAKRRRSSDAQQKRQLKKKLDDIQRRQAAGIKDLASKTDELRRLLADDPHAGKGLLEVIGDSIQEAVDTGDSEEEKRLRDAGEVIHREVEVMYGNDPETTAIYISKVLTPPVGKESMKNILQDIQDADDGSEYMSGRFYENVIKKDKGNAMMLLEKMAGEFGKTPHRAEDLQKTCQMIFDTHQRAWGADPQMEQYMIEHILPKALGRTPSPLDIEAMKRAGALEDRVKMMRDLVGDAGAVNVHQYEDGAVRVDHDPDRPAIERAGSAEKTSPIAEKMWKRREFVHRMKDNRAMLIIELVRGPDLDDYLKDNGGLKIMQDIREELIKASTYRDDFTLTILIGAAREIQDRAKAILPSEPERDEIYKNIEAGNVITGIDTYEFARLNDGTEERLMEQMKEDPKVLGMFLNEALSDCYDGKQSIDDAKEFGLKMMHLAHEAGLRDNLEIQTAFKAYVDDMRSVENSTYLQMIHENPEIVDQMVQNPTRYAEILEQLAERMGQDNDDDTGKILQQLATHVTSYKKKTAPHPKVKAALEKLVDVLKNKDAVIRQRKHGIDRWVRAYQNRNKMGKKQFYGELQAMVLEMGSLCGITSFESNEDIPDRIRAYLDSLPEGHAPGRRQNVEDTLKVFEELVEVYKKRGFGDPQHATQKTDDLTLGGYMEALAILTRRGKNETREQKNERTRLWHIVHNARIFDFPMETAAMLMNETMRYVYYDVMGCSTKGDLEEDPLDEAGNAKLKYLANQVPTHPNFPFDNLYFGFGKGLVFDKEAESLMGLVFSKDGRCACVYYEENNSRFTVDYVHGPKREWDGFYRTFPWLLFNLIELINDHNTFVLTEHRPKKFKQDYKKMSKRGPKHVKSMPDPYYRMKLKRKVVREQVDDAFKKIPHIYVPPDHRWDTRGHFRLKVQRGKLPLDDKIRKKLDKRGYKIYTINPIDGETFKELMKRPKIRPKQPDEWLAVKKTWVDSYINGPEGAPYVPSIREVPQ